MWWADPGQPVSPEIGKSRLRPLQPLGAAEALDPSVAVVPGIRIQDVLDQPVIGSRERVGQL